MIMAAALYSEECATLKIGMYKKIYWGSLVLTISFLSVQKRVSQNLLCSKELTGALKGLTSGLTGAHLFSVQKDPQTFWGSVKKSKPRLV